MEPGVAVSLAAACLAVGWLAGSEVERRRGGFKLVYPDYTFPKKSADLKMEMVDPGAAAVPFPAVTEKIVTDAYAGQKIVGAREDEDWEDDQMSYPKF